MMSETEKDEASEAEQIASAFVLDYAAVLDTVQDAMKSAYKNEESLRRGGAMVYLDNEADTIWNEAGKIAFDRWLAEVRAAQREADAELLLTMEGPFVVSVRKVDAAAAIRGASDD